MDIGERLKVARRREGLSQEEIANLLRVSRQTISNWECGKAIPTTENLTVLSKHLEIPLDELVGQQPANPEPIQEEPAQENRPQEEEVHPTPAPVVLDLDERKKAPPSAMRQRPLKKVAIAIICILSVCAVIGFLLRPFIEAKINDVVPIVDPDEKIIDFSDFKWSEFTHDTQEGGENDES